MELYQSSVMFGKHEQWQELNLKHISSNFNHQFQSVYTKEDTNTLPDKDNSTTKSMNDIYITENGVIKLLKT
jgi:hypothetical protein